MYAGCYLQWENLHCKDCTVLSCRAVPVVGDRAIDTARHYNYNQTHIVKFGVAHKRVTVGPT